MIRVVLPHHLRTLARVGDEEVQLEVNGRATLRSVLDALEAKYPMLRGTIREHETQKRRALVSFLPAAKMCRTNRRTLPCPTRSRKARSRSLSWARSREDEIDE